MIEIMFMLKKNESEQETLIIGDEILTFNIATYSQCSILTSKTNYKVYMATYNGSSWVRGAQKGSTITNKSYYWTGDPSNYSYPAACRSLTGTYPYQYGPM